MVRALAEQEHNKYSCRWARAEFFSGLKRHVRERKLSSIQAGEVRQAFESDEQAGVWLWLPVDDALLDAVAARFATWPDDVPLRVGDALHLSCAKENGFTEVYSNDTHLLAAASHFGLTGKNVLPSGG